MVESPSFGLHGMELEDKPLLCEGKTFCEHKSPITLVEQARMPLPSGCSHTTYYLTNKDCGAVQPSCLDDMPCNISCYHWSSHAPVVVYY